MATRDIRTSIPITACDVCGRTLLRGERPETYLDGGERRSVCALCTSRALQEGWVREGTMPPFDTGRASDRRRSLLSRLRGRRETRPAGPRDLSAEIEREARARRRRAPLAPPSPPEELAEEEALDAEEPRRGLFDRLRARDEALGAGDPMAPYDADAPERPHPATPPPVPAPRMRQVREPRHVRAIPSSTEQKLAAAIDVFNRSEHRRTVAGVARSLGLPTVAALAVEGRPALVQLVASWELCWYRYEIDLSEDDPAVRVAEQGYELDELQPAERQPNAVAEDDGTIAYEG